MCIRDSSTTASSVTVDSPLFLFCRAFLRAQPHQRCVIPSGQRLVEPRSHPDELSRLLIDVFCDPGGHSDQQLTRRHFHPRGHKCAGCYDRAFTEVRPVVYDGSHADEHVLFQSASVQYRPVPYMGCLLYTSDAADDLLCVDLGGRRIIKQKKQTLSTYARHRSPACPRADCCCAP